MLCRRILQFSKHVYRARFYCAVHGRESNSVNANKCDSDSSNNLEVYQHPSVFKNEDQQCTEQSYDVQKQIDESNYFHPNESILSETNIPLLQVKETAATQLYKSLRHMTIEDILQLVNKSNYNLDQTAMALCVKNIHRHLERIQCEAERDRLCAQLKNDLSFQILVAYTVKYSRDYESVVIYDMIRFLYDFGFTSDHFPMKVFLQLMKYHLDNLFVDQMVELALILNDMKSNILTQTLIEGTRLLVNETDIEKFDILEASTKVEFFSSFHQILNEKLYNYFLESIWKDIDELTVNECNLLLEIVAKLSQSNDICNDFKVKLATFCRDNNILQEHLK